MNSAPTIVTERLTLRAYRMDDFEALHALWSEPGVFRYISGKPSGREQSWARLVRYHGFWPMLGYGFWAIEHEGRYVGETGVANFGRDIDPPLGDTPEAGWVLHPAQHGKGFAAEALAAVLRWTDANLKHSAIVAIVDVGNEPSLKLAKKCGFLPTRTATYHGDAVTVLQRLPYSNSSPARGEA